MNERNFHQQRVSEFTDYIRATPQTQLAKFKEEVSESLDEHDKTGFSKEFADELTDTIIISIGLIHCMGLDFNKLFNDKMEIAWEKYAEVPTLIEKGTSIPDALQTAKEKWNAKRMELQTIFESAQYDGEGNIL